MPRCTPRPRPCTRRTSVKPAAAAALTYSSTTDGISRGANAWRSSSGSIGTRCAFMSIYDLRSTIDDLSSQEGTARAYFVDRRSYFVDPASSLLIASRHQRLDAAAHRKVTGHRHPPRLEQGDEVVEDLVGDRLVEDPAVAKLDHVVLQRLQLHARRVGRVGDADGAEIRQPGLRAERRELRTVDRDLEVPLGPRVGKRLERRA